MTRGVVWLVALGAAAYIALPYARPQIRGWRFRDAMSQTGRLAAVEREDAMRAALLEAARELGVPLGPRRLQMRRGPGGLTIAAEWEEIVRIRGGPLGDWVDTLHFDYEVESEEPKR